MSIVTSPSIKLDVGGVTMAKSLYELDETDYYMANLGLNLAACKFLGEGRNGKVFLRPDGKVIKICRTKINCLKEYSILKKVNGNKYFPRVYKYHSQYMIRDFVGGICLKNYIKQYGPSRILGFNIITMLDEFENLGFKRIDTRCKDIFVQNDLSLKIIDAKGYFTRNVNYPRHLIKGLDKLGVLSWFKWIIYLERYDLYKKWIIDNYFAN